MKSIPEVWGEIKGQTDTWLSDWGAFVVVILACMAAFGLGRLSGLQEVKSGVSITQAPLAGQMQPIATGGMLVGSISGDTYHYPWCAGAAKITKPNLRWFASAAAASAEGYRPAKNCTGLE